MSKYFMTARMALTGLMGESPLFLFDYALRLIRVILLLSLWRILFAHRGETAGMTLPTILTYTLIAEAFAEQLAARSGFEEAFWNGTVTGRFLQPIPLLAQLTSEMAGRWAFGFAAFSLPLLFFAPLFGVNPAPSGLLAALLFPLSLLLSVSVSLALDFIFVSLMVRLEIGVWLLGQLRSSAGALLSGALIPLALMPHGWGDFFAWLPFASMASAPLRIYVGSGDPVRLMAIQAGWSLVMGPLAGWMWRANREKIACYGG